MTPQQQCPWQEFAPAVIDHCEHSPCAWILEPFNAWSCLAYVAVGIYIIVRARRDGAEALIPAGVTAILVGALSFPLHATVTLWAEYVDLFSMFTFSTYALAVSLHRVFALRARALVAFYFTYLAASVALLFLVDAIGVFLFGGTVAAMFALEVRIYRHQGDTDRVDYTHFATLIAFFAVALIFFALDMSRIWCDPDNHFVQGHGLWHITGSACFYWLYRFYRQFDFGGGQRKCFVGVTT